MLNYDFIEKRNLQYLHRYKYTGVDKSLLYNYIFSPLANWCLQFVPLDLAPNLITVMGFICIVIPHIIFLINYGLQLEGEIPKWILWLTTILHLIYMNFDNIDGKQARRTQSSSPFGMILDHNLDSLIVLLQGINMTTAMQFGNTIYSYILYCIPIIPFYIIALEEYYTNVMNLPIINAAAEGTFSVAVIFAFTAYYGRDFWLTRLSWAYDLQVNQFVMVSFLVFVALGLPLVFRNISTTKRKNQLYIAFRQTYFILFMTLSLGYTAYFTPNGMPYMRYYMYTIGFSMSKAVGIVALCHVCNQNLPLYLNNIYLFLIALFNCFYGQIFGQFLYFKIFKNNKKHKAIHQSTTYCLSNVSLCCLQQFIFTLCTMQHDKSLKHQISKFFRLNELLLMAIDLFETVYIILGAAFITGIAELASWYLVYRTDDYKSLVSRIETQVSKYNKEKEQFVKETNMKQQEKKIKTVEDQLKQLNQEMTIMKMKSTFGIGLLSIITINSIGNYYQGIIVAKLPFEPISLLTSITHRGINGEDFTDCSYIFIYILSTLIFRANIQRVFGFEGPKMPFGPGGPTPWGK